MHPHDYPNSRMSTYFSLACLMSVEPSWLPTLSATPNEATPRGPGCKQHGEPDGGWAYSDSLDRPVLQDREHILLTYFSMSYQLSSV